MDRNKTGGRNRVIYHKKPRDRALKWYEDVKGKMTQKYTSLANGETRKTHKMENIHRCGMEQKGLKVGEWENRRL